MGGVRWLSLKENASYFSLLMPYSLVLAYSPLSICTLFWCSLFPYAFPYLYGPLHTSAGLCKITYFSSCLLPSQLGRPKIHGTDSLPWLCFDFSYLKHCVARRVWPQNTHIHFWENAFSKNWQQTLPFTISSKEWGVKLTWKQPPWQNGRIWPVIFHWEQG